MFRVSAIQDAIGYLKDNLLFLNAVTGSDTVSAPYKQGKKKGYKVLKSNDQLKWNVTVFIHAQANPEDSAKASEEFVSVSIWCLSTFNSLDGFRLTAFMSKNAKKSMSSVFQLTSLTPTSAVSCQHSFRTLTVMFSNGWRVTSIQLHVDGFYLMVLFCQSQRIYIQHQTN